MALLVAWNPTSATVEGGVPPTVGAHPVIAPDSDAKMKTAGAVVVPSVTRKSVVLPELLNTCPVGAPPGMVTLNGWVSGLPFTSPTYTSLLSVPLADTQNETGPTAMPQALTRVGSVIGATPAWSE